jgi:amino acid transporter
MGHFGRIYNAIPTFGVAVTTFSAIFGGFAYFVGLEHKVAVAWVLVAAFVPLCFCITILDMLRTSISEIRIPLPRISRCLALPIPSSPQIILIEPSALLGQNMAASIYSIEDEFEILIGDGYVVNVQRDERIQVAVTNFVNGTEAIWERLTQNRPDALRNTLIRPGNQRGT